MPQTELFRLLQQSHSNLGEIDVLGSIGLLREFRVVKGSEGKQRDEAGVLKAVIVLNKLSGLFESDGEVSLRKLGVSLHHKQIDSKQFAVLMRAVLLVLFALLDAADEVRLEIEEAGLVVEQLQGLGGAEVFGLEVEDFFLFGEGGLGEVVPALEVKRELAVGLDYL